MVTIATGPPGRRWPSGRDSGAAPPAPTDPVALYEQGLAGIPVTVCSPDGRCAPLPVENWTGPLLPGDESLLERCTGPALDVGCGPGRLTVALSRRGVPALGIDMSAGAVALARRAGARVLQRDVHGELPGEEDWARILLADGNLGIGGDPVRLLRRCRQLLAPDGVVLAELTAGDERAGRVELRLENAAGQVSHWFPWARLDRDAAERAARAAGLTASRCWQAAGRSFVALAR